MTDLLLVALVTIYVVDLSGFTDSWRSALARFLHAKNLKPLPPFDCSLCMVWWVCLIFLLASGKWSLPMVAYIALLSYMSAPLGQLIRLMHEALFALTNKLFDILWKIQQGL